MSKGLKADLMTGLSMDNEWGSRTGGGKGGRDRAKGKEKHRYECEIHQWYSREERRRKLKHRWRRRIQPLEAL